MEYNRVVLEQIISGSSSIHNDIPYTNYAKWENLAICLET
jgi:hypothetical protein